MYTLRLQTLQPLPINQVYLECVRQNHRAKGKQYEFASGLQFIEFLLLLIFQVESQTATQRQCSSLNHSFPSCNDNSALRVIKFQEHYQVTLLATDQQCYSEFCLMAERNYIKCNESCIACQKLLPNGSNYGKSTTHAPI